MGNWEVSLSCAIIEQALEDIKRKAPWDMDFISAVRFLQSEWFEALADATGIHTSRITAVADQIALNRAKKWYTGAYIKCNKPDGEILKEWLALTKPKRKTCTLLHSL